MRPAAVLALSLLFSTAASHAESVTLVSGLPAKRGQSFKESAQLTLDKGELAASLNGLNLAGAALAQFMVRMEREITATDRQSIDVRDSTHAIAFNFGGAPPTLQPKPSVVAGEQIEARLEGDRWKLRLQSGEADDSQKKALEYLGTYLTIVDHLLPQMYGTDRRTIGEPWQPDLSWTKDAPVPIEAEMDLVITAAERRENIDTATIDLKGRLRIALSATSSLDLTLAGTILRDLDHQTDLNTQIAGDLSFKGDLGKSLQGPATVSGQIQLDRQIQVVTP